MRSAKRCNDALAMGRSTSAAVAARRNGSEASSETGARGVRAISPSTSTMSGPRSAETRSEAWWGVERRKRRFGSGLGSHRRRRRHTSSLTQAIWRPAVETASISASASSNAERGRHLILVLQQQLVVFSLGQPVQLDPDIGEERRSALHG